MVWDQSDVLQHLPNITMNVTSCGDLVADGRTRADAERTNYRPHKKWDISLKRCASSPSTEAEKRREGEGKRGEGRRRESSINRRLRNEITAKIQGRFTADLCLGVGRLSAQGSKPTFSTDWAHVYVYKAKELYSLRITDQQGQVS